MTVHYRLTTNVRLLGGSKTIKACIACGPVLKDTLLDPIHQGARGQKKRRDDCKTWTSSWEFLTLRSV